MIFFERSPFATAVVDVGDVPHLVGEVVGHHVHVLGEPAPGAGDALDLGLTAEAALRADLVCDAGDLVGERGELVVGILSIVLCASILVVAVPPTPDNRTALVAFALFITSIVFACATISNDNLQDLKTGQLVGASPMRQQIALIVGVVAGAASIPPVLNLLAKAYGFAGAANVGALSQNPLPAPQATLISALAQGVIGGNLEWRMIGIGALVGVGLILLDTTLGAMNKLRIPPLAVGIGIYLPMSATFAVVVGTLIGACGTSARRAARRTPSARSGWGRSWRRG